MSEPKSKALAVPPAERLNELAAQAKELALAAAEGELSKSLALAAAVGQLRDVVRALLPQIKPLVGTALGFRTDRDTSDKGPYPDAVLVDVLVEATARGIRWVGNELNVIGGRCYATKEHYIRAVRELPGLTDLEELPAVPRMGDGGAVVKYRATWRLHGKPQSLEREFPVRLNAGMGADGALGKARRKMLAAVHAKVTGSVQSEADADAEDLEKPEAARPKGAALADRLERGAERGAERAKELPAAAARAVPAGEPELDPDGVPIAPPSAQPDAN